MLKKLLLSLALASIMSFMTMPALAQAQRDLTTENDYSISSDYNYDYEYDYQKALDDIRNEANNLSAEDQAAMGALATVWGGFMIIAVIVSGVIGIGLYIFTSFALMTISNKIGVANGWFAWIPFLNIYLLAVIAELNPWTLLLILVPGINAIYLVVLSILSAMKMSEKRGLDKMLGLLMLIPVVNYIFLGYLAWANIPAKTEVK